jgi:hypothetical protein
MTNSWPHSCLADPDLHPQLADPDPDHRARSDMFDKNLFDFCKFIFFLIFGCIAVQQIKTEVFACFYDTRTNPTNLSRDHLLELIAAFLKAAPD